MQCARTSYNHALCPQMEGANLYDVFQRISKGEFDPLPADQFSPTLRTLVARMLSVDPAGVCMMLLIHPDAFPL